MNGDHPVDKDGDQQVVTIMLIKMVTNLNDQMMIEMLTKTAD
jgi:hypothetical protein